MRMYLGKKGFTLLELIIVIIIIGILAVLGFTQYVKVVEKGRTAEAKTILGQIRTANTAYQLEHGISASNMTDLAVGAPTACVSTHYFKYSIPGLSRVPGGAVMQATRCIAGEIGKNPPAPVAYIIDVDMDGNWGGTPGYY